MVFPKRATSQLHKRKRDLLVLGWCVVRVAYLVFCWF